MVNTPFIDEIGGRKHEKAQKIRLCIYYLTKKSFFIAQGTEDTLRETYRHHLKMRREYSKKFIADCGAERLCLFIVERITLEEQANLMLVWLRFLRENGYVCLNSPVLIEMSEELYIDSAIAYSERKDNKLSERLGCSKYFAPTYSKQTCPQHPTYSAEAVKPSALRRPAKNGQSIIRYRTSEKEHELIRKRAQSLNLPISGYVKKAATECKIIHMNHPEIAEHTRYVHELRHMIQCHVFTIESMDNYHERNIDAIVMYVKEIADSEKKLFEAVEKKFDQIKKEQQKSGW